LEARHTHDGGLATLDRVGLHQTWTKGGPVVSHLPEEEVEELEERSQVTLAEPGALALFGFATGTWIAGAVVSGIFTPQTLAATAPVLIVFAGIAQFIAGLYALRKTNTFAGTAFCCYGANNVVLGFLFLLQAVKLLPLHGDAGVMVGYELMSFGFISIVLALAALRLNAAFVAILAPLAAGFILAGIPQVSGASAGALAQIGYIGGYCLIFSAGMAYYTASTLVLNSVYRRRVLPLFGEA
jgi:succinate-acetate transporter protein